MPFFIDTEGLPARSVKRRKLSSHPDMTRSSVHTLHNAGKPPCEDSGDLEIRTEARQEQCPEAPRTQITTSDREELIQCIKRGQRPTWVPKPGLGALCAEVSSEQDRLHPVVSRPEKPIQSISVGETTSPKPGPSAIFEPSAWDTTDTLRHSLSALHTGDFRHSENVPSEPSDILPATQRSMQTAYSTSPPWLFDSPSIGPAPAVPSSSSEILRRTRAPSMGSSLSSSFVMRVPTSPLVHAINNPSLDFSPKDAQPDDTVVSNKARRRTLPPNVFESLQMSPFDDSHRISNRALSATHYPGTPFHQGHRTRRSLSSFTYQAATSPQAAFPVKLRRPSAASDISSRQRASMVGSFEESILRGRMSTPPSKPLDFVAQIGVVGKGNCPASLKCPAHVTVPFPAVFYNYPSATSSRSISDDNPSPYVGVIDLEHNLTPPEPLSRRMRRSQNNPDPEALPVEITSPENTTMGRGLVRDVQEKKIKTPGSAKVPPGGAYRVPQKGQLQIIIKNPNKTAVKLFLIPYDLEGMPPGTKTFVRQRSFSSGPILEATLPEQQANLVARDPLSNKDILRYLIHLKFCSTAKGRFYLYDNIRVVFANRVPDGKEKLRNEVQLPEPRFSPYKMQAESGSRSPSLTEREFPLRTRNGTLPVFGRSESVPAVEGGQHSQPAYSPPLPFHISLRSTEQHLSGQIHTTGRETGTKADVGEDVSLVSGFLPSTSSRRSPLPRPSSGGSIVRGFSPVAVEAGAGLISRHFKQLSGGSSEQNM